MIRSLLRRCLNALVLLGVISIIAFYLSKLVPGDEVLDYLSFDDSKYTASVGPLEQRIAYARVAKKRGLDLPLFYLSVLPSNYPDSLFLILPISDRLTLKKWAQASNQKEGVINMYHDLQSGLGYACPLADISPAADQLCETINEILRTHDLFSVHHIVLRNHSLIAKDSTATRQTLAILDTLNKDIELLVSSNAKPTVAEWLPVFYWHGTNNQYHQWMGGFITFKPLTSLIDGRNAWAKILDALSWTLLLNGLAFILAIVLGVLIGLWSGTHDGYKKERVVNIILFTLFALPSFWLATLFIYFLSSGEWLSIFPAGGLGPYHNESNFFNKWAVLLTHLTLPVLCLSLGSLAYISRQMKQSVVNQFHQPYVFSLRSLGVSEKTILRKHVFRNALFPVITMIGGALPALLSGSLIIEVIFSIPGMGRLMYTSLVARDWPVVFPILMFGAAMTVFSYILTDVIYKWADPRVKSLET
jgi:peptide/nickel transport system permease protein